MNINNVKNSCRTLDKFYGRFNNHFKTQSLVNCFKYRHANQDREMFMAASKSTVRILT